MKIAMVGLGAMGAAAAGNLLAKGHEVRGVDLRQAALDALRAAGGTPASSIAAAVVSLKLICACMSASPGIWTLPRPSIRRASGGTGL